MNEKLYIIKVGEVYLSNEYSKIGKYSLCADPDKSVKIYTDKKYAYFIAKKLGGTVITFKED